MSKRIFKVHQIEEGLFLTCKCRDGAAYGGQASDTEAIALTTERMLTWIASRGMTADNLVEWPPSDDNRPNIYYLDIDGVRV